MYWKTIMFPEIWIWKQLRGILLKKINQKDLKWKKQLKELFKITRVARKVMGPALDFIHEKKKQELHRVEEMDRTEGKIEPFSNCALKVLLRKCMVTHCLHRRIKHSVNHIQLRYCILTIKYISSLIINVFQQYHRKLLYIMDK